MSGTDDIGIEALTDLALNLRWSWNHNPWAVLQTASPRRVQALLAQPEYRQRVKDLIDRRHLYMSSAAWFQQSHGRSPLTRVAYFSMEFALSEALPIYSGGLGNVAGDQLKAASDLGVPVIGGWRLLRALRLEPEVCHLNEGHAAFAVLERARSFVEDTRRSFEVALAVTRAGNVFTTHTPVAAGFDRFSPALIERFLRHYAEQQRGVSLRDLLALGRENPDDADEPFNMAYLAIRGSGAVNGVSRLHGQVSRRIFQSLFPSWPTVEVPVAHVTNGVHTPSWESAAADALWTKTCGAERWRQTLTTIERDVASASDGELWALRTAARTVLVDYARERVAQQVAFMGLPSDEASAIGVGLDPAVLTVGFARRFAAYKRPNLLLHDPARLLRILTNAERPVQLVIAGKAHPADRGGQELIRMWIQFIRRPEVRNRVIFIADYDLLLAEHLVRGVDVWVNTPRRPWEASGTSGMKVLVNGGLNLSELDGWWAEAYEPEVGWALGDGQEHGDDPAWDAAEANALYTLLEQQVIPEFYDRDKSGIPAAWVKRVRESMAELTPRFSADRTVREYTEQQYLPAAAAYQARAADNGSMGRQITDWRI